MANPLKVADGRQSLTELKEFAGFSAASQRYIRQSLDIGLGRDIDSSRLDEATAATMRDQARTYRKLDTIRRALADTEGGIGKIETLMSPLATVTAFDLKQGDLDNFGAYRFLYERLLGAAVRPWLPSAFCAAAALPVLHPDRRRTLLQSISESVATAAGWSSREPVFYPEWIEADDIYVTPEG